MASQPSLRITAARKCTKGCAKPSSNSWASRIEARLYPQEVSRMYQYPLELHNEPTGVWLSCPDVPEMNASGDTLGEAFAEALNGLESALSLYVEQRRPIPAASAPRDPALVLHLPALTVAKIMLWNAMCDE